MCSFQTTYPFPIRGHQPALFFPVPNGIHTVRQNSPSAPILSSSNSIRQNYRSAEIPFCRNSIRQSYPLASIPFGRIPFGKNSVRQNSPSASIPFGRIPLWHGCLSFCPAPAAGSVLRALRQWSAGGAAANSEFFTTAPHNDLIGFFLRIGFISYRSLCQSHWLRCDP